MMTTLNKRAPTAFFHGKNPVWENGRAGRMDCLQLVSQVVRDRGFQIEWVGLTEDLTRLAASDLRHLHIVLDDVPLEGDNIVYCIPSYLRGFWYFDCVGTRNNSSIAALNFHPEKMSATFAQTFGDRLRTDFVEANFSKYDQTLLTDFDPAPDAICIFAQEFVDPPYHTHHMDYPTLIDAVIAAKGDRVVHIKIHPKQSKAGRFNLLGYHDPAGGVFVTDHSIHGLLPTASVAISLSSAVLLEAQMHHVPGIVAGQVDFGHNMIIVADPVQISGAIDQATTQTFAYDKFLAFFFAQNMVQPKLKAKARAKIGAVLDRMKGVY